MYFITTLHSKERREREEKGRREEGKKAGWREGDLRCIVEMLKWIAKTQYFYVGSIVSIIT